MALLKLGAIVTAISGKVGGQTFGIGAQGNYIKNNGTYSKNPTKYQEKIRINTSYLLRLWQTLTPVQLLSWKVLVGQYAYFNRLGEKKAYNPYQIFMVLNQGRIAIGQSVLLTGTAFGVIKDGGITIGQQGLGVMNFATVTEFANLWYLVSATPPLSSNLGNIEKRFRNIAVVKSNELQLGFDFFNDYVARFGAPVITTQVGWKIQPIIADSGQRANPIFNEILDYDI